MRDDERGKTGGTEGKLVRPRDDGRDKAGRSETQPDRRTKTRRPVRRDKVVRPQEDARDKAGRSKARPHRRAKNETAGRREIHVVEYWAKNTDTSTFELER